MPDFSKELQVAIDAAKIGAKTALKYFDNNTDLNTKLKSDNSLLTVADPATEKAIKKFIYSKYPGANILGEELGGSTEHESFWTIDPIDGTRIFARGINSWAVLISYYTKGEFIIGVCYFPIFNELYCAEKGKGAYLNGRRLSVSKINPLNKSLINSGNPSYLKKIKILNELIEKAKVVRNYETTYADCLVPAGKMDASIDPYDQLWDFAPFSVIVPEAGGKITNMQGHKLKFTDRGCIISNGLIHDEIIKIVNKYK